MVWAIRCLHCCLILNFLAFPFTQPNSWNLGDMVSVPGGIAREHGTGCYLRLRSGLGLPTMSDFDALGILAKQLLSKAWETTRLCAESTMRAGNLKPYESGDQVSKIFIPRSNDGFTKSTAKQRLVWIASVEGLSSFLQQALQNRVSTFSVEHLGVWALVVAEGRDMLSVQPRVHQLLEFPDGDDQSRRIVLLQGPDLHRYVQMYESLYVAQRRNCVVAGGDGANASRSMELFRAWLGLESLQDDREVVNSLLGSCSSRMFSLFRVQLALKFEFSAFQRECILGIEKPITHWSFVAGAGKTQMLLALVYICAIQSPTALTVMSVRTHAVARDLESSLVTLFQGYKRVLRLEVEAGSDGFVDVGEEWMQRRLQEEMSVEQSFLAAIDRSLCLLVSLGIVTRPGNLFSCVHGLVRFLLAMRHEYLDEVVYGRIAELNKSILDSVHVVVVSASLLNKLQGSSSSWSSWFLSRAFGLLLIDELPGQCFE